MPTSSIFFSLVTSCIIFLVFIFFSCTTWSEERADLKIPRSPQPSRRKKPAVTVTRALAGSLSASRVTKKDKQQTDKQQTQDWHKEEDKQAAEGPSAEGQPDQQPRSGLVGFIFWRVLRGQLGLVGLLSFVFLLSR